MSNTPEFNVNELRYAKLNAMNVVDLSFNTTAFKTNLETYKTQIDVLEQLGATHHSEFIEAQRNYDNLLKVSVWFDEYNTKDDFLISQISKVKRLIYIKSPKNINFLQPSTEQYAIFNGLYIVVEMYIIPSKLAFPAYQLGKYKKNELLWLREVAAQATIPNYKKGKLTLPSDGMYSSSRVISSTHFAVIVDDEENPYAEQAQSSTNWRFINSRGESV